MVVASGTPIPADRQLDFLRRVGRILDEGRFTTTYKFALLVALANLSVKHGADDDSRVERAAEVRHPSGASRWPWPSRSRRSACP